MRNASLTIIIPAFNEEDNIEQSILTASDSLKNLISDYEIIIFNDCSTDNTGKIIEASIASLSNHKVIHNDINRGLGWIIKKGYELASKEYVIYFAGDNQIPVNSFKKIVQVIATNKYDVVITFHSNMIKSRPFSRYLISKIYNFIICISFGLDVKYTTGPTAYKTEYLKNINCISIDRFVQTEILIKYLNKTKNFVNLDMLIKEREKGQSMNITLKAVIDVLINYFRTIYYIYFK